MAASPSIAFAKVMPGEAGERRPRLRLWQRGQLLPTQGQPSLGLAEPHSRWRLFKVEENE